MRKARNLEIEGVSVFICQWMKGHGCALPPFGILVGPDHNQDLIRHEFGHILQYKSRGFFRFYFQVGIPSLLNLFLLGLEKWISGKNQIIPLHSELTVEKEANALSFSYFNKIEK